MKVAVMGAHPIEARGFFEVFSKRFSILELIACSDPDMQQAKSMADLYKIKAVPFDEILQDPEIRIVMNATFPEDTEWVTEKCLRAKKNVFTARQIANTLETGRKLYDLAVENGVELSSGPDVMLGAGIQTARYMVDHGAIGEVHSVSAVLARDNHSVAEILPHVMKKYGGILYDMSGFFLYPMYFMLGGVKRVVAFGSKGEPTHTLRRVGGLRGTVIESDEYEVISVLLEFDHDVLATLHLNSNSIFQKDIFKVAGDNGEISIGYTHEYDAPVTLMTYGMQKMDVPLQFGFSDAVYGVGVADMAWAITNDRPARLGKDIALHNLELLKGIETSIETGRPYEMTTTIERPEPLEEGHYGTEFWQPKDETSLAI